MLGKFEKEYPGENVDMEFVYGVLAKMGWGAVQLFDRNGLVKETFASFYDPNGTEEVIAKISVDPLHTSKRQAIQGTNQMDGTED